MKRTEREIGRSWSGSRWILDWSQQALLLSRPLLFLPVGFTLKASLWSGQGEKDQLVTCFCRGSFSPVLLLYPSPSPSAFCPSWAFLPQIKSGQHLGLFIMRTERKTHTHTHTFPHPYTLTYSYTHTHLILTLPSQAWLIGDCGWWLAVFFKANSVNEACELLIADTDHIDFQHNCALIQSPNVIRVNVISTHRCYRCSLLLV